jgi:demethylmenaquinone methyltransferase/2-methoxy-6-polyprenyl-1,4-benzoquinol methylase
MFTRIASQYSLVDHLTTFGMDLLWRPQALWLLQRRRRTPPRRVLDLGCGPGDLTFELAHRFPQARIVAADFTPAMVRRASDRVREEDPYRVRRRLDLVLSDAQRLPYREGSFDLVTSAFLIRNLSDIGQGFREMRRVLAPGGNLLALEVGEPPGALLAPLFHSYFDRVVPKVGRLFGTEEPYRYLSRSLRNLPSRASLVAGLKAAGFTDVVAHPLTGGIVTTFLGTVPGAVLDR